jgi:hypothetical protein
MPCFEPWVGYYAKDLNPSGKRSIVANPRLALEPDCGIPMPCGRCVGCRLKYSRNWAIRIHHEASLHAENQFLTLTFAPEHLPPFGNLRISDCQSFMKRYREWLWRSERRKVRMAYCGEYGSKNGRPHYHFIIFGHMFGDRRFRTRRNGFPVWSSERLEKLWPFGRSEIGSVTFDSAAYVARYILEKKHGPMATKYWVIDPATGELLNENSKEFFKMSRRPGIGQGWLDRFGASVYERDQVIVDGRKFPPPKFYDSKYELVDPVRMSDVKAERLMKMQCRDKSDDNYDRLQAKKTVQLAALANLPRSVE